MSRDGWLPPGVTDADAGRATQEDELALSDYQPGNVRWAAAKEQSNNRRPRRSSKNERA